MNDSAPRPIRILLIDDSEVVRLGLRTLLTAEAGLQIVAEAGTTATGVSHAAQLKPDVILLDIRLPDGTGLTACREILRHSPDSRVIMLTSIADDKVVDEAIVAGAHGYLLKEINARGLVQAIREVADGKSILDPAITARVLQLVRAGAAAAPAERAALASLSPQEKRVLALIAEGHTNKEVGVLMNLTEKTVKNYLSNVFEKLQVSRRAQAAALFAQEKATGRP